MFVFIHIAVGVIVAVQEYCKALTRTRTLNAAAVFSRGGMYIVFSQPGREIEWMCAPVCCNTSVK